MLAEEATRDEEVTETGVDATEEVVAQEVNNDENLETIVQSATDEVVVQDGNDDDSFETEAESASEEVNQNNSCEIALENSVVNEEVPDVATSKPAIEQTIDKAQDTSREHPAVVVVFVTALIDNSPAKTLYQADLNSLKDLIFREKHLQANIIKLEYGQHFSREFRNRRFQHTIELRLFVSTSNLWEGARSYIWRHFGKNEWSKENGSRVMLKKIHVKS